MIKFIEYNFITCTEKELLVWEVLSIACESIEVISIDKEQRELFKAWKRGKEKASKITAYDTGCLGGQILKDIHHFYDSIFGFYDKGSENTEGNERVFFLSKRTEEDSYFQLDDEVTLEDKSVFVLECFRTSGSY